MWQDEGDEVQDVRDALERICVDLGAVVAVLQRLVAEVD
jgi:hypothetical protein